MNRLRNLKRYFSLLAILGILGSSDASAQLYLDWNGAGGNTSLGTPTAGTTYTWDLANSNKIWNTSSGGAKATEGAWINARDAILLGSVSPAVSYTLQTATAITTTGIDVGANTVTVSNGTGGSLALSAASSFNVADGASLTISANIGGGANTLTVGNDTTNTVTAGGTLAFSGTNTYTGLTTVTGGTLDLKSLTALPSTNSLTLNGGTLLLSQAGTYTLNAINVTANSVIDFGGAGVTNLSLTNLTISSGVTLRIDNWVRLSDQFTVTNQPTIGGFGVGSGVNISKSSINFSNYGELAQWNGAGFSANSLAAVPEPSTYGALLMAGCAGLFGLRRWRAKRRATPGSVEVGS
jgi:fibronectin-binding autotransporter adhesin